MVYMYVAQGAPSRTERARLCCAYTTPYSRRPPPSRSDCYVKVPKFQCIKAKRSKRLFSKNRAKPRIIASNSLPAIQGMTLQK